MTNLIDTRQAADADRFLSRMEALDREIRALRGRRTLVLLSLEKAQEQKAIHSDQMALAQQSLDRAEQIAAYGFLPLADLEIRKNAILSLRQSATDREERILSLRRELLELAARLDAIPLELRAVRAEAASQSTQTALQQADLQQASAFSVASPVPGRVSALPVRPGETISAGDALAFVVPKGSRMQVHLLVPSRSIGLIRDGQRVRIKYQAFPHQRFGAAVGVVRSVARSAAQPSDLGTSQGEAQEPMFRVVVEIRDQNVRFGDEIVPLLAGALLQADIEVERSSLIERMIAAAMARRRT